METGMKTNLWRTVIESEPSLHHLFDTDAVAGLGPFSLPKSHWITHAAQFHDPWYDVRPHPGCRAEGDVRLFNIAHVDALHAYQAVIEKAVQQSLSHTNDPIWEEMAERLEVLCRCYLLVRGPIGYLAWNT